jgi:DnaJ homolog subfamily B member 12
VVSRAFQVLSDPDKRAIFDRDGADPDSRGGMAGSPFGNGFPGMRTYGGGGGVYGEEISPDDLFNMFFGGGGFGGGGFNAGISCCYVINSRTVQCSIWRTRDTSTYIWWWTT